VRHEEKYKRRGKGKKNEGIVGCRKCAATKGGNPPPRVGKSAWGRAARPQEDSRGPREAFTQKRPRRTGAQEIAIAVERREPAAWATGDGELAR